MLIPSQSDTAGIHRLWTECGSSFKRQLLKDKTQFMFAKETQCFYLVWYQAFVKPKRSLFWMHPMFSEKAMSFKSLRAVNPVLASTESLFWIPIASCHVQYKTAVSTIYAEIICLDAQWSKWITKTTHCWSAEMLKHILRNVNRDNNVTITENNLKKKNQLRTWFNINAVLLIILPTILIFNSIL